MLQGWQLLSIDATTLDALGVRVATGPFHVHGPEGSGHEHDFIPIPSPTMPMWESSYLPGGLLYLHWTSFDDDSLQCCAPYSLTRRVFQNHLTDSRPTPAYQWAFCVWRQGS